jgi:hypothetical protein
MTPLINIGPLEKIPDKQHYSLGLQQGGHRGYIAGATG